MGLNHKKILFICYWFLNTISQFSNWSKNNHTIAQMKKIMLPITIWLSKTTYLKLFSLFPFAFSLNCHAIGVVHKWSHAFSDNFWPPPHRHAFKNKSFITVVAKSLIPLYPSLSRDVTYWRPLVKNKDQNIRSCNLITLYCMKNIHIDQKWWLKKMLLINPRMCYNNWKYYGVQICKISKLASNVGKESLYLAMDNKIWLLNYSKKTINEEKPLQTLKLLSVECKTPVFNLKWNHY